MLRRCRSRLWAALRPPDSSTDRVAPGALDELDQDSVARLRAARLAAEAVFGIRPAQGLLIDVDEDLQRQSRSDLSRLRAPGESRPDSRCHRRRFRPAQAASFPPDDERSLRTQALDHA